MIWLVSGLTCVLAFLAIFFLVSYLYVSVNYNYWKSKRIQYFEPSFPFGTFKDVLLLRVPVTNFFEKVYNKTSGACSGLYGPFGQPIILLKDLNLIKAVLVTDFHSFSDRGIATNVRDDPAGSYNLFMVKNPEWKTLRNKLTPLFTSVKLKSMFNLVSEIGHELTKYLEVHKNKFIEAKYMAMRYTIDVITTCAFGIKSYCLRNNLDPFYENAKLIFYFSYHRAIQMSSYFFLPEWTVKLFRFKFLHPDCVKFMRKIYNQTINHRLEHNIERNDLFQALLELKKNDSTMSDDMLLSQSVVFLAAGFESSSTVISFTLHHLAHQLDLQSKLREEIHNVIAKHDGQITYDAIMEMTYLDMVVSETLRLYAPLGFLTRACTKRYTLPGTDITVEPGMYVYISLKGLHKDPNYFTNPELYDPERFSKENKTKIISGSYMPFGMGPHNCIGDRFGMLTSKIAILKIINEFEVLKSPDSTLDVKIDPKSFVVSPLNGLPLKFQRIATSGVEFSLMK